ncbi:MAG TPA: hypothetical protein VL947_08390 [Cytophagales bacterium]|nr:hypothetical protein [Cytophagales bacterium]
MPETLPYILLQFGSPRGPSTSDIYSTLIILAVALAVELALYILKPKLRSWMKPILFTTIMAVLIFVFTFVVVRNKEIQNKSKEDAQHEMHN